MYVVLEVTTFTLLLMLVISVYGCVGCDYIKPIKVICSKFSEAIKLQVAGPQLGIFGEKSLKLENNIFSSVNTEWILNWKEKKSDINLMYFSSPVQYDRGRGLCLHISSNQVIMVRAPLGEIIMVLELPERRDQLAGLSWRYLCLLHYQHLCLTLYQNCLKYEGKSCQTCRFIICQ